MSEPNPQAAPTAAEPERVRAVVLGPKPPDAEYGYFERQPHASTREELLARLREGRPTPYVWTPETEGIVHAWAVPYLFDAYRARGVRKALTAALVWATVAAALMGFAAARGSFRFENGAVILGFVAAALSFYSWLELGRFRRLTPEKLNTEAVQVRELLPPRRGPARYTQVLAGSIAAVVLVQAISVQVMAATLHRSGIHIPILPAHPWIMPSVNAAGIVKEAIRQHGEYWRLLSGAFLHDGLLHFAMNVLALVAIGRFLEMFAHRAYVPLVFLLTAVAASTSSYFLSHADASVGASGGILGLFGFLAVLARVRRKLLPPGFGRAITADIAVVAAMGLFGWGYIDNAAHAGGFISGAALGWLMIPRTGTRTAYWEPSKAIRVLGDVSLGILVIAAVGTIGVMAMRLFV